ncbi:exonuclease 3'-5' domain containing 1 [Perkinsus chesapeaki]|uniref:Exonuclease 3'-5' domain containing 1 n=1 Tax=Perkinsus chesapeaki TaxID=330153 RepID=A0A7J6N2I6_PERCH|nr:exonuclease 3'-5' domain containing 1 [Perkinsus chesapeaki]
MIRIRAVHLGAVVRPVPSSVTFVSSSEHARAVAKTLGEEEVIGVDCEGVMLGRFGQLCTIQIATELGHAFMFDACRDGVVQSLGPLLSDSSVLKVFHDCREDSSALYHQHDIALDCVFDTQATMLVGDRMDHQTGYWELVRQVLFDGQEDVSHESLGDEPSIKTLMAEDPQVWRRRPLSKTLVEYALSGCLHLIPLYRAIQEKYLTTSEALTDAIEFSDHWVSYRHLNPQLKSAADVIKPPEDGVNRQSYGRKLQAMLASRTPTGELFWKLNAAPRVGFTTNPRPLQRFRDVSIGDIVDVCVSKVSWNGKFLYLDRYDHDFNYYDRSLRPRNDKIGSASQEYVHQPPAYYEESSDTDPLLRVCLPTDGDFDSDGDDVDHEPRCFTRFWFALLLFRHW